MSILIKSVTITPNELYTGQSFKISAKVEEVSWNLIKNDLNNWQSVRDGFTDWNSIKNFTRKEVI